MTVTGSNKVYLLHGWGEGPYQSRLFREQLIARGYTPTDAIEQADIIITHSGGCCFVPRNTEAKIIYINPVYWPGKSIVSRMIQKLWRDLRYYAKRRLMGAWCIKTFWNTIYVLGNPVRSYAIMTQSMRFSINDMRTIPAQKIIIRNMNDPWCTPHIIREFKDNTVYIELPGEHDDLWLNPIPYIKYIEKN
ncbi:MAG: hypothetical protein JWL85_357 [Candidatus Saccharibacteria bacterium]|nr:hypothetical protein [Candidatus Saccharibacteria bacterium]